jgi:hydrophobe/amphiphile efflux-1 (HAE1) family protein
MPLSRFFIDRPIFAIVLSILITILGAVSIGRLPISEYPEVVPPVIAVNAVYPGASPETIAETVAAPLEQAINGVEDMLYVSSQSTSDGRLTINVTFDLDADLDRAQMLVQNRVSAAEARLPEEVRRIGVTVEQSSTNILMFVNILSPDGTFDPLYVSNYAYLRVLEQIQRLDGVGQAQIFGGSQYAMRVWLDPEQIAARGLTAGDVIGALRRQNVQVASGVLGAAPMATASDYELTIQAPGRLIEPEQFEEIVIAADSPTGIVRLKDVGRVELGAQDYTMQGYLNGKEAVGIAVFQRPGSNALATSDRVIATMEELSADFPEGLEYDIVYNPTEFVGHAIDEVGKTLVEAVLLVVVVVFLFLQSARAAIIPILAIPVSIVGSFAVFLMTGGSINSLTMFGLVLAIGIVVDDAIVVVENVERNLAAGLSPREAARKSMDEVGGALIAIALVLTAVFVPVAFISGISGQFYKQFALAIATATVISAFVSLTLSPALAALLLRPHDHAKNKGPLGRAFGVFNRGFDALGRGYGAATKRLVRMGVLVLLVYGGLVALTGVGFQAAPKGFIPEMDRGYGFVIIQLPAGASLERTREVLAEADRRITEVDGVDAMVSFTGFQAATNTIASNAATAFFTFDDYEERAKHGLSVDVVMNNVRAAVAPIDSAMIIAVTPPAVEGLGSGAGVRMMIQDRAGHGYGSLAQAAYAMMGAAGQTPGVASAVTFYESSTPRVRLEIDRDKAEALRVPVSEINQALEVYLGSAYVNDFNYLGRTYRVTAQADAPYRDEMGDISDVWVRSLDGTMIPLSAVVTSTETAGPQRVPRHNNFPAAELDVEPAPGASSGQLIAMLEGLAAQVLPQGFGFEWRDIAFIQQQESSGLVGVFLLAAVFVFLVLAAQYESLTLPLAVILVVPMAILGALIGVFVRGLDVNILTQVAFVVLVGLAAKNAILIVEFAKQLEEQGLDRFAAAQRAAQLRLRPILMTSLAFILGVTPLVFATGAGAEQRVAIGVAVFSGMIGVTVVGLMLTPTFYVLSRRLSGLLPEGAKRPAAHQTHMTPAE